MATNTAGDVGQSYPQNMVHFLAKTITYADNGTTVDIGVLPPGAVVIRGGAAVTTAFNGDTTNTVDIGVSTDTDGFATDLALGTVGVIVADEMATSNDFYSTSAQTVQAVVVSTASASAGSAVVWVEYIFADR